MLSKNEIQDILQKSLNKGFDFVELFFEDKISTTLKIMNKEVIKYETGNVYGVGIRLLKKTDEIYIYTNKINHKNILSLIEEYYNENKNKKIIEIIPLGESKKIDNNIKIPFNNWSVSEKITKIMKLSQIIKEYDEKIIKSIINLEEKEQNVLIANSKGVYQKDFRPYINCSMAAIAKDGQNMEEFYNNEGGSMGLELFNIINFEVQAKQVAKKAIMLLTAEQIKPQNMTLVVSNGEGGVIFHEACGHSLEATSVARGLSPFCNKINQKIASDIVTAYDDGTIENSWGKLNFDDEGHPTQKNLLIEKGILKNYLIDYRNSLKMKMQPTGSSRRQSYKYSPTSRMNSTYIAAGKDDPQKIIKDTKYGLYAESFGGGTVTPTTGEFNFKVKSGYLIENGKLTKFVKGMMIIGKGQDILLKIDRVANDLVLKQGYCGSISGYVPVDLGQPTIRVTEITVGGSKK
ncbi:TldD/PmbA family protein [Columbia Basin potato purple top phytoplasma]|uniref:TldD/PmbA family protein n=1 Tax=Columbia Basin potato purple top phytoplasma TaxID=307134 RepID=A0ABT5L8R0_9MOLU|nr:TldD/PmbA family protein [Columbia Basin potato purple top phytoplasma]MDC9031943.1 TldD/PmbA family protein [Columbia Basin potato purple top phytoplasma]